VASLKLGDDPVEQFLARSPNRVCMPLFPSSDGGPALRIRRSRRQHTDSHPCINPHAAALDLGGEELWAYVPEDRDAEPVRPFGTFTPDL
jgi:hypothetical protein